jgi:YrbI family 3-deoxy-D-manno-octulosonate 8-phosphate phosphatase
VVKHSEDIKDEYPLPVKIGSVLSVLFAPGPADWWLKTLGGHPLLAYSAAVALQAESVDCVVVVGQPETAELVCEYASQLECSNKKVRNLHIPAFLNSHADLKAYFQAEGRQQLLEMSDGMPEMVAFLNPNWPLHPQQAFDRAVGLLSNHPTENEVISLWQAPTSQTWWTSIDGKGLLPFDNKQRRKYMAQTGHFDIIRLNGGMKSSHPLPYILDLQFSLDVSEPTGWDLAEWNLTYSGLGMVRPGYHRRSLPSKVSLLVMDFDGVMTDNRVWVDEQGHEMVAANRSDSLGLYFLRLAGIKPLVISMETNPVVTARCKKMNVPVLQGINDKAGVLLQFLETHQIMASEVVYLGNDINDLPCFPLVGCSVAVADAEPRVLRQADLILSRTGGHGAVRELCDLLINRSQK